jgi:hypothetical protein
MEQPQPERPVRYSINLYCASRNSRFFPQEAFFFMKPASDGWNEELVAQRSSMNTGLPAADPPKTAVQILHDKT